MEIQSTPLSTQLAGLRTALVASEKHVCVPARIHALIIACLARIFDRLEQMLRLWQEGALPPPQPPPQPEAARTPRETSRPGQHTRSTPARAASGHAHRATSAPVAPAPRPKSRAIPTGHRNQAPRRADLSTSHPQARAPPIAQKMHRFPDASSRP